MDKLNIKQEPKPEEVVVTHKEPPPATATELGPEPVDEEEQEPADVREVVKEISKSDLEFLTSGKYEAPSEGSPTTTTTREIPRQKERKETREKEKQAKKAAKNAVKDPKKEQEEYDAFKKKTVAAMDKRANSATEQRNLPPFVAFSGEKNCNLLFYGPNITDPVMREIYLNFSKHLNAKHQDIAPFLGNTSRDLLDDEDDEEDGDENPVAFKFPKPHPEKKAVTMRMVYGFFAWGYAYTPVMFGLLQGPRDPAAAEKSAVSMWSSIVANTWLYRYYNAVMVTLFTQYSNLFNDIDPVDYTPELIKIKDKLIQADDEKRGVSDALALRLLESLKKASAAIFAGEEKKDDCVYITQEKQRTKTTKEWVNIHRDALDELARNIRLTTLFHIELLEAVIAQLLGVPGDGETMWQLTVPLQSVKADAISDKMRAISLDALEKGARSLVWGHINQFPEKKLDGSGEPVRHHAEGVFLEKLLNQEGSAAIRDIECLSTKWDRMSSLSYLWIRLCSWSRLWAFREEYERDRNIVPSKPAPLK